MILTFLISIINAARWSFLTLILDTYHDNALAEKNLLALLKCQTSGNIENVEIRYHARAIRSVGFHPSFPLLASSSDDGSIQLFHARVYSDLMSDPLIVPLKILRGHAIEGGLGVLDIAWLHSRPWLVSAGADKDVAVWCP